MTLPCTWWAIATPIPKLWNTAPVSVNKRLSLLSELSTHHVHVSEIETVLFVTVFHFSRARDGCVTLGWGCQECVINDVRARPSLKLGTWSTRSWLPPSCPLIFCLAPLQLFLPLPSLIFVSSCLYCTPFQIPCLLHSTKFSVCSPLFKSLPIRNFQCFVDWDMDLRGCLSHSRSHHSFCLWILGCFPRVFKDGNGTRQPWGCGDGWTWPVFKWEWANECWQSPQLPRYIREWWVYSGPTPNVHIASWCCRPFANGLD